MAVSDIERSFPSLNQSNYRVASSVDFNYNCLAFAVGDESHWWEPPMGMGQYWPPGFADDIRVETVAAILRLHGFVLELDRGYTPQVDAIAVYGNSSGEWLHFARFTDGAWKSKLGSDHDIVHTTLECLEGSVYGVVVLILGKKP